MEEHNYKITLVCFNCGEKKDIIVNRPPRFGFELVQMANESGMYGVIDMKHSRSLVFCNKNCADNQKTKNGNYRVRSKIATK
jgi:hypothetical protein